MSARKYGLVSLLLLAMAGNAWSQEKPATGPQRSPEQILAGTITSGAASWALTSTVWTNISAGPSTNFLIGAQNQVFQDWWWYRLSTDTREFTFPTPTTETYVGNTATLSWTNLNGTGLNAQLVVVVADAPARTTQTMTISNPTAAAVNISVFRYADFDLNGTFLGDSAVINTSPTFMTVSDGPVSMPFYATGAANYTAAAFPGTLNLLTDAAVSNFANTGLPFGPGDFGGGFQWASRAVAAGASTSYESVYGAPPPNPAISLTKTVGTTAGACAATDAITVELGTTVYYCFRATNTGNVPFTVHSLVDSQLGTLLTNSPVALAPGATSPPLIVSRTPTATVTNTATWTAAAGTTYAVNTAAPFAYVPINATGTALNLTDDSEANIVSPFPITYFGVTSTNLRVGNNGGILFNATTGDVSFANAALPNAAAGLAIFPFWDDLDDETGNVYWQVQGAAPNRQLIVEWFNRPHFSNTGSATFQVIISEGSNNIRFQYLDVDFGSASFNNGISATVGLNASGTTAQQVSFNTASINNSQAIQFTAPLNASATDTATVTVLIPNINVTPASLSATAPVNQTTSAPLNIGNTGQGTLNWNIAEEPVGQPQSTPAGRGTASDARDDFVGAVNKPSEPDTSAPVTSTWRVPQAVLFNNGPLITNPGAGAGGANVSALQLTQSTFGFGHAVTSGFRMADDFVVGGSGWLINTVTFFAYQTNSTTTSTINAVNVRIWNGPPGAPGSLVVFGDTTTNRLASSTYSGINRTTGAALTDGARPIMANTVTINTFLPAGTYWFDWQTGGTLASGPWAPQVTLVGQQAKPGANGLQFNPTTMTWGPANDGGPPITQQDLPFIIDGLSDCANPSDVPWLNLSQTSGSNTAGTSTAVTVGFNATGLAVGNYQARLCATSNDPDVGPGNGTGLVIVPVSFAVTPSADLVMTLTDAPDPVTAGNTLTYTATVTNTGPTAADNVSFSLPVPAGTTFVSAAGTGGVCTNNGTVTCTFAGSTAVGASVSATIVVQVPAAAANGSTITATATATSPTFDPNLANNVATATTGVITSADLQVALTASVNQTPINVPVTFTATSLNLGPSDAQNVSITVTLTPDFRYSSHSAPGATCTVPQVGTTGAIVCTWAGATAPGVTRTLTVVAFSNVEGPTVVNASTTSNTTDPVPGNNSASVTVTVGYLVEEIPTLGNLGLLLMGLMIALVGFVAVRRQA